MHVCLRFAVEPQFASIYSAITDGQPPIHPEPLLCRCCASYADIGITSIPREVRNDLREKAFGKPRPSDIIFELFRHSGFFEDCLPESLRLAGATVNALVGIDEELVGETFFVSARISCKCNRLGIPSRRCPCNRRTAA